MLVLSYKHKKDPTMDTVILFSHNLFIYLDSEVITDIIRLASTMVDTTHLLVSLFSCSYFCLPVFYFFEDEIEQLWFNFILLS